MSDLSTLGVLSGDQRIVYECVYAYDRWHSRSNITGFGETRFKTREQSVTHIVAPSYALAGAAFSHKYRGHGELLSCTPICSINYEVTI